MKENKALKFKVKVKRSKVMTSFVWSCLITYTLSFSKGYYKEIMIIYGQDLGITIMAWRTLAFPMTNLAIPRSKEQGQSS